MYSAIWAIIKPFLPIIAAVMVLAGTWFSGYTKGKEQLIAYRAVIETQSTQVKEQAEQHAIDVNNRLQAAAEVINAQSEQHAKANQELADTNRTLLAQRLQQSTRSRCDRVSEIATTTSGSDATNPGFWLVSESVSNRLIDRHNTAEQVAEIALACQQYVKTLQEQFK